MYCWEVLLSIRGTAKASSNACTSWLSRQIPEDEFWCFIEFGVDGGSQVFDLIAEKVDVLGDGLLGVVDFELEFVWLWELLDWAADLLFHLWSI